MDLLTRMRQIVGDDFATQDDAVLEVYTRDFTDVDGRCPAVVTWPASTNEVAAIVRTCAAHGTSVHPVAGGMNNWGLHLPKVDDTVVIDVSRMDAIVEVNERDAYAVVEAGVTVAALEQALAAVGYWTGYPRAPSSRARIVANALIEGWGHVPLRMGNQAGLVNSLEVVLPTGEVARVGSAALTGSWHSRHSMPDLVGLFLGWHGSTGIVTKMGIQISPRPAVEDLIVVDIDGPYTADSSRLVERLWSLEILDDIEVIVSDEGAFLPGIGTWPSSSQQVRIKLSAPTAAILDGYRSAVSDVFAEHLGSSAQVRQLTPADVAEALKTPPRDSWDRDGWYGPSWGHADAYAYLPLGAVADTCRAYRKVCAEHRQLSSLILNCIGGSRTVKVAHWSEFDLADEADTARGRAFLHAVVSLFISHGGTLWKAPPWVKREQYVGADPGFVSLLERVKGALDPSGTSAPGNLGYW
ncbi:MAG: FAD-binding protein [Propionibacteriales bacterium]|nr:FAD-binding protein [Propionibacteriales bacterium]